ncbi:Reverse transcriptase (RNA-dependent DNA polymerase) [Popillia japonica]|uniref:Reverse transcriptase (RNA-dependent DNA polymerase) n=1 Tax=Popillia japonica TaxID=7064 RepID=A0AAW1KFT7_POPJA
MGGSSSKEEKEIIISQAGNSGGATATSSETIFTLWEVTGLIVALLIIAIIGFFIWRRCKKSIHRTRRNKKYYSRNNSVKLYETLLKPEEKKHLINYILKTRLSENAKIRLNKTYDSVDTLLDDIRKHFTTKKSATTISNQLHNAKQLNRSISEFGSDIEQLFSDLTLAQADNNETLLESLRPVNEKIAINSFCNGIKNHELRTILKARNCTTLKDAINTAIDEEKNKPPTSNVFSYNNRGYVNYRGCRGFRNSTRTLQNHFRNKNSNFSRQNMNSFNSDNMANYNMNRGNNNRRHRYYYRRMNTDDIGYNMNGIIGTDFLNERSAVINFEKFSCSFWNARHKIVLPLESKHNCYTIIPPRCEIIKYFWVDNEDDCIVLPNEVSEGVFTASIIRNQNFKPTTTKLSNFNSFKLNNTQVSLDRVNKVLDLIDMKTLNKEVKDSIQKICAKYSDVFLLENDPVTIQIDEQIDKMLADGIIEETRSNWSSPLLIVPKKPDCHGNKQWRIVVDYRLLNKNIEDDRFPLPNITEILDSLSGAFYFTHLDLSQGYYQVELDPRSRKYTAFTTNKDRLRQVNLKLNPVKCEFLKKEILYLGHLISAKGITPDQSKISTIQNYPVPKNADELDNKFILTTDASGYAIGAVLVDNKFILTTDASGYAIGAVLSNSDNKPIAYASRALNKSEIKYPTIDKELLAIVWAVKHFRPYLSIVWAVKHFSPYYMDVNLKVTQITDP